MWIVIVGNPFDGLHLYGPFHTAEEASEWASWKHNDDTWWVMNAAEPEK